MCALALHIPAVADDASILLLPTSRPVEAKVMQLGLPTAASKTAEKLSAALTSQPEWAKGFIASGESGKPLPYHPRLGISADEYRAFLETIETGATLLQVGTVRLSTERLADGTLRLITEPPTSKVHGITIARNAEFLGTPHARLVHRSPMNNKDPKSATGRWNGTQWRHESTSSGRHISVKFALGRRTDHGDVIIYYDVNDVQAGQSDAYDEVLLFPAPSDR
jgi:hypothetical protein